MPETLVQPPLPHLVGTPLSAIVLRRRTFLYAFLAAFGFTMYYLQFFLVTGPYPLQSVVRTTITLLSLVLWPASLTCTFVALRHSRLLRHHPQEKFNANFYFTFLLILATGQALSLFHYLTLFRRLIG